MKKIQLTIPEPCHENWDKMTASEKGRVCGSCQKTVVDFSNMNDREIAEFFKKPPSKVCGHFNQDQLDRDITIPRKRIPWIKYFFQFSLPAFLVSAKASAQGKVILQGDTLCMPSDSVKQIRPEQTKETIIIDGMVIDDNGNGIPYATIKIVGTKYGVATDEKGAFKIKTELNSWFEISSVGYESRMLKIDSISSAQKFMLERAILGTMGEMVIVNTRTRKKKGKTVPVTTKIDTAFKNFKVFPNPAQNNSYLKIDCGKLENGEYVLSIIDMSGEVLQTQEILIDSKKKQIEFLLENVSKGAYVVHLFNRKTAVSFTEKIIVQ
jgi:hypothetical protein